MGHWNLLLTLSLRPHYAPESTQLLTEMSTGMFAGGKELTTLPPSCANCLEIWEPQPPGNLRLRPGIALLLMWSPPKLIDAIRV